MTNNMDAQRRLSSAGFPSFVLFSHGHVQRKVDVALKPHARLEHKGQRAAPAAAAGGRGATVWARNAGRTIVRGVYKEEMGLREQRECFRAGAARWAGLAGHGGEQASMQGRALPASPGAQESPSLSQLRPPRPAPPRPAPPRPAPPRPVELRARLSGSVSVHTLLRQLR